MVKDRLDAWDYLLEELRPDRDLTRKWPIIRSNQQYGEGYAG
jgi:hypothetical protein